MTEGRVSHAERAERFRVGWLLTHQTRHFTTHTSKMRHAPLLCRAASAPPGLRTKLAGTECFLRDTQQLAAQLGLVARLPNRAGTATREAIPRLCLSLPVNLRPGLPGLSR